MRRWLRRRREQVERIEDEAGELIRLFGDDAYAEVRWREHTASSSERARQWNLIALAIARIKGKRIGLDLSTPIAMNAVFAPDREPDRCTPRPSSEIDPLDGQKRIPSAESQMFRIQLLCAAPIRPSVLNEIEIRATDVSEAIVSTARITFPPNTIAVRILDGQGQIVFERRKSR
jgi:hypothetical protein